MIKSFTAFTHEVDDADAAVSEVLEQLDLDGKNRLQKNSIGIVSCYAEYIDSGVWAALCEKLPFEVIGVTTIANMTAGEIGETMLCLMVLTSDDISFATGLSDTIATEDESQLNDLYLRAFTKLPGKPSLILSFAPLLNNFSSDFYVESMSKISGNVLNFGTLAVDHNADYHDSKVLFNGESWADRFAVLLFHGTVSPEFYVGAISDKKVFSEKGIVTDSSGNILKMVNKVPVKEYLRSLGLTVNEDGSVAGINAFPVIMDYNDGTKPIIRAMFALTPEGHAVCGGNIPVGAVLSLGSFDEKEITETSLHTLNNVIASGKHKTLIMYSCIGRYFAQGYNTTAEFEALLGSLNKTDVSYIAAYSGGELCPVYSKAGESFNRNHNNTFVICAL